MHCNNCGRYIAIHLHVDSSNRMHRNLYNRHDIRHMLTERQLQYQQHSSGRQRRYRHRLSHRSRRRISTHRNYNMPD